MRIERMQSPITGGEAAYARKGSEHAETVGTFVTGSNPDGESGGGSHHYPHQRRTAKPEDAEAPEGVVPPNGVTLKEPTAEVRLLDITV